MGGLGCMHKFYCCHSFPTLSFYTVMLGEKACKGLPRPCEIDPQPASAVQEVTPRKQVTFLFKAALSAHKSVLGSREKNLSYVNFPMVLNRMTAR